MSDQETLPLDFPMTKDRNVLTKAHEAAAGKVTAALAAGDQSILISVLEKADFEHNDTTVILKAGKKLRMLKKELSDSERDVYLIENCGMPDERIYHGLSSIPDEAGYLSLMIV